MSENNEQLGIFDLLAPTEVEDEIINDWDNQKLLSFITTNFPQYDFKYNDWLQRYECELYPKYIVSVDVRNLEDNRYKDVWKGNCIVGIDYEKKKGDYQGGGRAVNNTKDLFDVLKESIDYTENMYKNDLKSKNEQFNDIKDEEETEDNIPSAKSAHFISEER